MKIKKTKANKAAARVVSQAAKATVHLAAKAGKSKSKTVQNVAVAVAEKAAIVGIVANTIKND